MLILNNIINESKYKIIKNKNGIYLTFNKEDETYFDIILMKKAYNLKYIVDNVFAVHECDVTNTFNELKGTVRYITYW